MTLPESGDRPRNPPDPATLEAGGRGRPDLTAPRQSPSSGVIKPEHLYKAVGLLFLLLLVHSYFAPIARVLLLVYAAAILAVAMNVLVGLVPQHRRFVSVVLGLLIFGGIGLIGWLAVPALADQLRGLSSDLPRFREELDRWNEWIRERTGLNVELFGDQTRSLVGTFFEDVEVLGTAWGVVEGIVIPLVIIIGGLYAVAKPNERLLSPLLHAIPADRREDFRRLFALLGTRLKGWVKGTLMSMSAVGLLVLLGLWILGVPYVLLLAVISGGLEIVPILGPWVAGAITVAIAFMHDPGTALWVAVLMIVIQQLETNIITPLVMSQAAEVHPFFTLFALLFFGSIFGLLGVVLAVPLVLLIWTILEVLWVDRAIQAEGDYIEPLVR